MFISATAEMKKTASAETSPKCKRSFFRSYSPNLFRSKKIAETTLASASAEKLLATTAEKGFCFRYCLA
eukprot:6492505-Amphidinium_carterae.2